MKTKIKILKKNKRIYFFIIIFFLSLVILILNLRSISSFVKPYLPDNFYKIASFIVTDINTDGTLEGTNEVFIKSILEITDIPVIASGGVGSISDLLSLVKFENSGLFGVIVGKALYEKKFTINEANNVLSSDRLNDFDLNRNYYA